MKKNWVSFVAAWFAGMMIVSVTAFGMDETSQNILKQELVITYGETVLETIVGKDKDKEQTFSLRATMEFLGYQIDWNESAQLIMMKNSENTITVKPGENKCNKNGSRMYLKKPVFVENGVSFLPESFVQNVLGIRVETIADEQWPDGLRDIVFHSEGLSSDTVQVAVDNGQESWRTDPREVAMRYAADVLGITGVAYSVEGSESLRVVLQKENGEEINMDLYQPVKIGSGGIWEVDCWFDGDHKQYQARDLSALQPLFHRIDFISANTLQTLREAVVTQWTDAYTPYYRVLGFEARAVKYVELADRRAEMRFVLTMVTQNYYKDPDTVGYIQEAKAKGLREYATLYEEYTMARTSNYDLKIMWQMTPTGGIDSVQIMRSASLNGEDYVPVDMDDYFVVDRHE